MADNTWEDSRLQKRVDDSTCAACRRPILPGHRVQMAFICINPKAYNPEQITEKGIELGRDFEIAHIRCDDPFLDGRKIIAP